MIYKEEEKIGGAKNIGRMVKVLPFTSKAII